MSRNESENFLECRQCGTPRIVTAVAQRKNLSSTEQKHYKALIARLEKVAQEQEGSIYAEGAKTIIEGYRKTLKEGLVILTMCCPGHIHEISHDMTPDLYELSTSVLKDHILQCKHCGSPIEVLRSTPSGESLILTVQCTEHGEDERNIAKDLFTQLKIAPVPAPPEPVQPVTPVPAPMTPAQINFCANCGAPRFKPDAKFCVKCGRPLG